MSSGTKLSSFFVVAGCLSFLLVPSCRRVGPNHVSVSSEGRRSFPTLLLTLRGSWCTDVLETLEPVSSPGAEGTRRSSCVSRTPQTRLDGDFGCNSRYSEPRDSYNHGRRYRDVCFLESERARGDPIHGVRATTPLLLDV